MTKISTCALSYVMVWAFSTILCTMGFVPIPAALVPGVPVSRVARASTSPMGPLHLAAPGDLDPVDRVERNIQDLEAKFQDADDGIRSVGQKIQAVETAIAEGGSYLGIFKPEQLWKMLEMLMQKEKMLMKEKQMLMDEKKQLMKGKPRQPSMQDDITKELADFSSSLVNATLLDSVLQLPEGVLFLGENDLGSKIFVRKSNKDLAGPLFAELSNWRVELRLLGHGVTLGYVASIVESGKVAQDSKPAGLNFDTVLDAAGIGSLPSYRSEIRQIKQVNEGYDLRQARDKMRRIRTRGYYGRQG